MVLDNNKQPLKRIESMLLWDVNTGYTEEVGLEMKSPFFHKKAMETQPFLKGTIPNIVDEHLL